MNGLLEFLKNHTEAGTLAQWFGAIATVAAVLVALFKEVIINWLSQPVLKLHFDNTPNCVTKSFRVNTVEVYFLRIATTNIKAKLAKSCRAYLVSIERFGASGKWESTTYCEILQLGWVGAEANKFSAVDIPRGVSFFFDVLSTYANSDKFQIRTEVTLNRVQSLVAEHGRYRFTVVVTGDGVKEARANFTFDWTGQWDRFNVNGQPPPPQALIAQA